MKRPPLVSILIPTYNRADTLGRTLRSILDQTVRDFEIIVVDDGSTDGTRGLVESSLQGVSFRYIYQANGGVAKAREAGIRASRGEYLAFCDSDDLWVPDKLERQLALFKSGIALVFSDAYACRETLHQLKARFRWYELCVPFRGEVYQHLVRKNFIVTSSVIVRRPFLADFVAFPLTTVDDWQMWLSVARRKGLFEYAEQPLIYYYEHSQGISKQKIEATKARLIVRKYELEIIKRKAVPDTRFIKAVKLLILKDTILFWTLNIMPRGIVNNLSVLYYSSLPMRKVLVKLRMGN